MGVQKNGWISELIALFWEIFDKSYTVLLMNLYWKGHIFEMIM